MSTVLQSLKKPHNYFLFACIAVLILNTVTLTQKIYKEQQLKKLVPFYFQGLKFSGLEDVFKNVEAVGYYTDQDIENRTYAAQFAQAQYVLAPVILDLNYASHPYILIDCTSESKAMEKIKELKAIPLRKNKFGIILAIKFL